MPPKADVVYKCNLHFVPKPLQNDMWGSRVTRKVLQRSINRLREMNEFPGIVEEIAMPQGSEERVLTVRQEADITSALAFISATSHDKSKVMAACFDTKGEHDEMTIRIAGNDGVPPTTVQGMIRVADCLSRASRRENRKDNQKEEDLSSTLREVVKLDNEVILSRLRSRWAKKRGFKPKTKPFLFQQLDECLSSVIPGTRITETCLECLKVHASILLFLSRGIEELGVFDILAVTTQDALIDIVKATHNLCTLGTLSRALEQAENINVELRESLPMALGKIAQYYTVAHDLLRRARKYKMFQSITVEEVDMRSSLRSNNLDSNNLDGKFHAEIQLLFFYETFKQDHRPPRVICSSKSACFLCNLFLKLHGKFYTPKTHGRLYPAWRLPELDSRLSDTQQQELRTVLVRLKNTLDRTIKKEENRPSWDRTPQKIHFESTLNLPIAYSPSLLSDISDKSQASSLTEIPEHDFRQHTSGNTTPPPPSSTPPAEPVVEVMGPQASSLVMVPEKDLSHQAQGNVAPPLTLTKPSITIISLIRGQSACLDISDHNSHLQINSPTMEITFQTSIRDPSLTGLPTKKCLLLKLLHQIEILELDPIIVSVKDLVVGDVLSRRDDETIFVGHGRDVFSIAYASEAPCHGISPPIKSIIAGAS